MPEVDNCIEDEWRDAMDVPPPPPKAATNNEPDARPVVPVPINEMAMLPAFFMGSQVYGTPTEKSDIDLVIFCDVGNHMHCPVSPGNKCRNMGRILRNYADSHSSGEYDAEDIQLKFGRLNILIIKDKRKFRAWFEATQRLHAAAPVSRKTAIAVLDDVEIEVRKRGNGGGTI